MVQSNESVAGLTLMVGFTSSFWAYKSLNNEGTKEETNSRIEKKKVKKVALIFS